MNNLDTFSLAELQQFLDSKRNIADAVLVQTYEDFVSVLYKDIDDCIREMEAGRSIRQLNNDSDKRHGENRLTEDFRMFLIGRGYDAKRETDVNGHCDLIVQDKKYLWLGEAKIHNHYDYLKKGFNQLLTRYSLGVPNANQGGILIYIYNKNAAKVITQWQTHLTNCNLNGFSTNSCNARPQLAFYSTHSHKGSGLPFTVRHMGIVLHFDPQDKK